MSLSLFPDDDHLGLLTDLYELTMAAGYHACGQADQRVTFELWIRRLPACRNYLIAAGLEQVVHYLTQLRFSGEQIEYLRNHPAFQHVPGSWFERLETLRFDGDLWAIPEGTPVFAGEPLLRVTAPIMEAQIVETYLITTITFQTMAAAKAARVVTAAQGRPVVDFGSRRAHGPQAGLLAARASYLAGCAGTSNTEAARLLGIPSLGTQAHSWIMTFDSEIEAFRRFGEVFPTAATMLVDTYDTLEGVRNALASGAPMQAVRLDSGDLGVLSKQVRKVLDDAGRNDVKIVASGDLNEHKIEALMKAGSPIDVFGVGTEMVTSRDEPTLSTVYKLVEQQTASGLVGRLKMSAEKKTYPFAKQVFRQSGPDGRYAGDVIAKAGEQRAGAKSLLVPVLSAGKLTGPLPTLADARRTCEESLACLPRDLLELERAVAYPVMVSNELEAEALRLHAPR